jgi:GNAT superfamily N-acetyltransferase
MSIINMSRTVPTVRRATPADLTRIGRLGALLVSEHYDFDPRRFLAARPETPAGYASFTSTQLEDPEHRGRGVGRLLLEATLEFFRSRGVPRVVLSTAERNEAAQRLFASAGFRRTMIEMTRELDDPSRGLQPPPRSSPMPPAPAGKTMRS